MKPIRSSIAQHPFLAELAPEHLDLLSDFAMQRTFADGELILKQGDLANRFYLINTGHVLISSRGSSGNPAEIETLGAGDVLGWSWLFEPRLWQFDARAVGETETIFFYATLLLAQLEENTALGCELLRRMAAVTIRRLQKTRERLVNCPPASDKAIS
ncbi:MAG: cyclic nucleotide-binding domain-containing protein [Chthoniobacterales bacterium]